METAAGIWEQVARQVPLDVLVLILAAATFAAGIITYCCEAHSALDCVPSSPKDIEDASPVSVKSLPPEKAADIELDRRHKAREDLPEPEPEKCDEDSRRNGLEVCLERLPGEAWGFAWHSKAFCEQRLIVVGIDPDSPAGRWQLQREHQGLPTVQRGDELVCANDVTQHSSMQISLVVANRLRLKFLRAEGVADLARGVMPKLEAKDACKEEVLKETPALPPLQPDTFAESDTDDLAETGSQNLLNYDGVPRNFWSYQRLPRSLPAETVDAAPVDSQSEQRAPEAAQQPLCEKTTVRSVPLRSRSDPPAAPRRRGGSSSPASRASRGPGAVPHLFTRSRTAGSRSPASKHSLQSAVGRPLRHRGDARDGQIVSCGSESENASRSDQCPSTDWEYMMDNRAQQCQSMPDPSQGPGVVMMLALQPMLGGVLGQPGHHGPFVPAPMGSPHVSDASSTPPPPLTSPKVPSMPASSSTPGAGLMVPMPMNHGFAAGASTQNAQVMGWAPAWRSDGPEQGHQASASSSWLQSVTAEENTVPNLAARSGKKTYRAGQRLTARRLRAAQRAAELNQALPSEPVPSPSPPSEPSSEEPPGAEARTKPRRRAGVRVRRRREHAIARRREQEEQGDVPRPQPVGAVPPGPLPPRHEEVEVDGFDSPAELDVQVLDAGSPVSGHQWAASKRLRSQPRDSSNDLERDVIGREVLINGLVHTPQLNGHWGRVAEFDPVHRCYLVHAFVSGSSPLALRLRRDAFVAPKTNPPSPDEIVEGVWQPSLRIQ